MFDILLDSKPILSDFGRAIPARIVINDFYEDFLIPIDFWSKSDYVNSWINSLNNKGEANKAILLVSAEKEPNFVFSWVLYFECDNVFIQNKILFSDEYEGFSIDHINNFIPDRMRFNDDGEEISEWEVDLKSIDDFYKKINSYLVDIP